MEYLVIDGYNVINAWGDIFNLNEENLEDCRDKLLSMLSNYQGYSNINVIVVFDAHMKREKQVKIDKYDNITVVFTKKNMTADHYIERFVYKQPKDTIVRVVTSDYLEQTIVLSGGGIRVTPKELKKEIMRQNKNIRKGQINIRSQTNSIVSNASEELIERLEEMRRNKF